MSDFCDGVYIFFLFLAPELSPFIRSLSETNSGVAALSDVTLLDENTYSLLNVDVDLGLGDGFSDLVTPGEVA